MDTVPNTVPRERGLKHQEIKHFAVGWSVFQKLIFVERRDPKIRGLEPSVVPVLQDAPFDPRSARTLWCFEPPLQLADHTTNHLPHLTHAKIYASIVRRWSSAGIAWISYQVLLGPGAVSLAAEVSRFSLGPYSQLER